MRLKASYAKELTTARNTLTQRVQGPLSTGTVEMDASGLKNGNVAGFGVFRIRTLMWLYAKTTEYANSSYATKANRLR